MADKSEKTFCHILKEKTRKAHDSSDKLINLKLAVVLTNKSHYGKILREFYHVFSSLEHALDRCRDHHHVGPLIFRQLYREDAFEKDLTYYLGEKWNNEKPSVPTQIYVRHIEEVCRENPTLLVAYAHSMYLALLAGGQIIKKIVKKTLGLTEAYGLEVFSFECDKDAVKKEFMDNINNLELTDREKELIIQEKIKVFSMNNEIAKTVKPTLQSFQKIGMFVLLIFSFLVIIFAICLKLLF